jgi:hypothetical protein
LPSETTKGILILVRDFPKDKRLSRVEMSGKKNSGWKDLGILVLSLCLASFFLTKESDQDTKSSDSLPIGRRGAPCVGEVLLMLSCLDQWAFNMHCGEHVRTHCSAIKVVDSDDGSHPPNGGDGVHGQLFRIQR